MKNNDFKRLYSILSELEFVSVIDDNLTINLEVENKNKVHDVILSIIDFLDIEADIEYRYLDSYYSLNGYDTDLTVYNDDVVMMIIK